jgi:predicted MFS family arabinose efflux permease
MGMPMFAAFALGAPLGTAIYEMWGFAAIGLATLIAPLAGYMFIRSKPVATSQHATAQAGLRDVLRAVRLPGLGLALCSMGFGSITIFIALLFSQRGWSSAWAAFTLFSVAFIVARVVLGYLPDRIGGARVAFFSIIVEAFGQALIWLAPAPGLALVGATLTGLGYSLAYPALGLEAVRRVPPKNRALAMGTFTASLDLTLALAGPGLGVVASATGIGSVYLVSTLTVGSAAIISFLMMRQSSEQGQPVSEHRA